MIRWFGILLILLGLASCKWTSGVDTDHPGNYRDEMRSFVINIANYARLRSAGFIVIPQNGIELTTWNGYYDGRPVTEYLDAIDGVGQEDLLYGYDGMNEPTPAGDTEYWLGYLNRVRDYGRKVLAIDYCGNINYVDYSYSQNEAYGFISFAADQLDLNDIPDYPALLHNENINDVYNLDSAKNFLYLIDPADYSDGDALAQAVANTNYDCVIVDVFINGTTPLTPAQVATMQRKLNGAHRLVIAYMSIGEAENYRYYWQNSWYADPPAWLDRENPDWPGNYKVRYWMPEWQSIIYGSNDAYLDRILNAGFDGVYLDIVDAFEYFEEGK